MTLMALLKIGGALHVGLLCAGASLPRAVHLRGHLATLPPFLRQLYWVYYSFIGLCLLGFGSLTYFCAPALAGGTPLARALSAFLAVLWAVRLGVAGLVFDVRPYLTTGLYRLGYRALNGVFAYLTLIYAWSALH